MQCMSVASMYALKHINIGHLSDEANQNWSSFKILNDF